MSLTFAGCVLYTLFWHSPKLSLALQYQMGGFTTCAKNIWTCLKFEKQSVWGAVPSHWTSYTMEFGPTAHRAHISMHVLTTDFPGRLIFHFTDITWPVCSLILQNQTTAFGTMSKASIQNTTCQIGGLKHPVCSCIKRIHKNAQCCDIISTINIAVNWMIWWSPMRRIQTVMINERTVNLLQACTGHEGSRRLRLPDFITIGTRRW